MIPDDDAIEQPDRSLGDALARAPFTLCMSSGFFGFFSHAGMLAALVDAGLAPARVTGSSAGGLIAGCWAAGLDTDDIRDLLFALRREDFWDPAPGAGLLRGQRMDDHLRARLPTTRFDQLRTPFAVSVWDMRRRATHVVDQGDVVRAIRATCAVPFLFHPVRVDGRLCLDGGIADRSAFRTLAPGERTLHHHLSSRSPWRRPDSPAMRPTAPVGTRIVDLGPMERLGPFRLERGPDVWRHARDEMARRLTRPTSPAPSAGPAPR